MLNYTRKTPLSTSQPARKTPLSLPEPTRTPFSSGHDLVGASVLSGPQMGLAPTGPRLCSSRTPKSPSLCFPIPHAFVDVEAQPHDSFVDPGLCLDVAFVDGKAHPHIAFVASVGRCCRDPTRAWPVSDRGFVPAAGRHSHIPRCRHFGKKPTICGRSTVDAGGM